MANTNKKDYKLIVKRDIDNVGYMSHLYGRATSVSDFNMYLRSNYTFTKWGAQRSAKKFLKKRFKNKDKNKKHIYYLED